MNNFKDFNIKFQRILDEKGYTQRSFAKIINKSSPYINSLCVGKRKPTAKAVKEIADALGVPVAYFLDESISNSGVIMGNNNSNVSNVTASHGGDIEGIRQELRETRESLGDKIKILEAKLDVLLERTKGK